MLRNLRLRRKNGFLIKKMCIFQEHLRTAASVNFSSCLITNSYRITCVFPAVLRVFGLSGPRPSYPALGPRSHKSFNQLNLLLGKVRSLWSCAHYFQWFTGYLKHVVLLMPQVHVLKKLPYFLMCTYVVLWILSCVQLTKCMFKVNNACVKIRLICMCSNLKINTAWLCSLVFIVDFDHSQHIRIVFLLWTLNKYLSVGCERRVIMFWKPYFKVSFIQQFIIALNWNKLRPH